MRKTSIQRLLALITLTFLAACLALAQDYSALLGKWSMTSESNGDPVHWTLMLKDVDSKLAVSLMSEEGEAVIKDATYTDGVLKFKAPYQAAFYDIVLKLNGDQLEGTWNGNGESGRTSGKRASASK